MLDFSKYGTAERVFQHFTALSKIPHGSGNTAAIADYLVDFARGLSLDVYRDGANNVLIKKPAAAGMEGRPTVILQGHTDMVIDIAEGVSFDAQKDALKLMIDGDFLTANGTTLGADDGIAVAYAMAILESDSIPHPALEVLLTSDEEIGLIGASAFDTSLLSGKLLINIDSEEEGYITAGCAGGLRNDITLPLVRDVEGGGYYKLTLTGLAGGHSGVEIDKGRLNAIKLLCEVLLKIPEIRICSIEGGNMDNAIPRSAECTFTADKITASEILTLCSEISEIYRHFEPNMSFELEKVNIAHLPFTKDSTKKLLGLIDEEPFGVIAMSEDIEGLVETSMNQGIVRTAADSVTLSVSLRSSKRAAKAALKEKVRKIAEKFGATSHEHGEYPEWEYRRESHLREVMINTYLDMYGKTPTVLTIHAGLECGIFADGIEGLDCVSIGPDSYDIHTSEERLSLSSATRVYEYLLRVLKEI
ncbi:MAG: aminoacyl-histidine dipeptidase [Clostridia bacterium]|nr:aminoacyl-histidine dipeptidase [Clostridia bacterium]